jgi:ribosomal protein L37AE/L43A
MEILERVKPPAIEPRVCDCCRAVEAVRYLDHDIWACAECARLYLARLQWKG